MPAANIIFLVAVSAAVLAVILLALVSPVPNKSRTNQSAAGPWLTLSLYVHPPPRRPDEAGQQKPPQRSFRAPAPGTAIVFRHRLMDGPLNSSRALGSAHGIVVPLRGSEMSVFNILHLTLDGPGFSGSLSVEARPRPAPRAGRRGKVEEEDLIVVGGTGSFAFARGHATMTASGGGGRGQGLCQLQLWLRFPRPSRPAAG